MMTGLINCLPPPSTFFIRHCHRAFWQFDALDALNYFSLKQKGKFPRPNSLVFCRPRISVTHFASPGIPLDTLGCGESEG